MKKRIILKGDRGKDAGVCEKNGSVEKNAG